MRDSDRERDSRRILQRVDNDTRSGGGLLGRGADRLRGHLEARDADQSDPIEVWGTRIGRAIAFAALALFALALAYFLSKG